MGRDWPVMPTTRPEFAASELQGQVIQSACEYQHASGDRLGLAAALFHVFKKSDRLNYANQRRRRAFLPRTIFASARA
jgi:hypothetical protein